MRDSSRSRSWLAALCLLALPCAAPLGAEKQLRVGVYENSPKVAYAESGKAEGIFVDLIEAIAAAEGWKIEYVPGTWSEGLARLAAGQIDLMPDVALTAERQKLYAFHREPVLSSWNQVYTRRGAGIRSLLDLEGKRVAVLADSVQEAFFRQMVAGFGVNVVLAPQPDFAAAFSAVARGEADAVVTNRFYGARHAAGAGLEDTAIIFSPSRLHFAAPKGGDPLLLEAIDKHLIAFKSDSTSVYFRSLRRWTAEDLRPAVPRWLATAALAATALLAAAAAWLVVLRRQVAARTREIRLRNEELLALNRTLRAATGRLKLSRVLEEAMRGALALTGLDGGAICIRGLGDDALRVAFSTEGGRKDDRVSAAVEQIGRSGSRVLLECNATSGPLPFGASGEAGARWNAFFPLTVRERQIGLLCLVSRRTERPAQHALDLVNEICVPVALAIENARLYEQTRRDAREFEERVAQRTRELAEREAEARRLAEERDLLLENVQVGVAFTGDGRILRANRKLAELFGYDDAAELTGKGAATLFRSEEDFRRFSDEVTPILAADKVLDIEWQTVRRDGVSFLGHTIARAIRVPGYRIAAIWMIEDITARRAAERKVVELSTFLDAIIEHMPNPVFYMGSDMRFLGCNRAYEKAFGVSRARIIGKTVLELDFVAEADRRASQEENERLLASAGSLQREATYRFADGKLHQTLFSLGAFRRADGSPGGLVGVIVDITPLKEAQAAQLEATGFLHAILDNIPYPVFYKDTGLRYVGCNRAYENAFAVKREDLIGKTVMDLEYLPMAERLRYQEEQTRLLAEGTTLQREAALLFADGRVHHTLFSASGYRRADGSPAGVVAAFADISVLKEAEAALVKAKQAAEAADRIKSAFLATMSHELRTPLNSIIGFTGIVLAGMAGPLTEEQAKQLGIVRDSARHLLALINDILDISKIEAGELSVAAEPFDLAASIRRAVGIVAPLAEKKGLALRVDGAEQAGEMTGDARRVEQILLNLLNNAVKFTQTGSVTLKVAPVQEFRPAGAGDAYPAVRLRVADTGIGIKPEDLAQLFTPFRQVDSGLTRNHEGTGLGLAICRRLTELMGGILEVESRWGEGSAFTVTLPLAPPGGRSPA